MIPDLFFSIITFRNLSYEVYTSFFLIFINQCNTINILSFCFVFLYLQTNSKINSYARQSFHKWSAFQLQHV